MIQCDTCGTHLLPNTLFCGECGAALYQGSEVVTDRWTMIHFTIQDSGRRQGLPLSEPIMIGRADPDQGYWPQLDLSDDGAVEKGVSRRHAEIQPTAMDPVLIDKDSVNGTWIDDIRLKPGKAYPLPASGRVRFGNLDVLVFLE